MHWHPGRPARAVGDQRFTAERYFGPPARPDPSVQYGLDEPQAFLVEMGPDALLRTHFHPVDQFQVFVSGSGRFGRHDVCSGSLHYSDANTPYGPLSPHGLGLGFLTLRARTNSGAEFMPESRDLLRSERVTREGDAPHRNLTLGGRVWPAAGSWQWHADDGDGLRIGRVLAAPGAEIALPAADGGGCYLVVLAGAIAGDVPSTASSATGSLYWLVAGTSGQVLTASDEGASLVWLQFPVPSRAVTAVR